jgi:hypothetical protein
MKSKLLIFNILIISFFFGKSVLAQDQILNKLGDTLIVKVTALEKEKVAYYLLNDTTKKQQEVLTAQLYKIIWRNGKEFIIDKEFDAKLPKSEVKLIKQKASGPNNSLKNETIGPLKAENTIENKPKIIPPELRIRDWLFWQSYLSNGKRVGAGGMESILLSNDYESYSLFTDGTELKTKARKNELIGFIPGMKIIGVVGNFQSMKALKLRKKAIRLYEEKRKSNTLKNNLQG